MKKYQKPHLHGDRAKCWNGVYIFPTYSVYCDSCVSSQYDHDYFVSIIHAAAPKFKNKLDHFFFQYIYIEPNLCAKHGRRKVPASTQTTSYTPPSHLTTIAWGLLHEKERAESESQKNS